ncbi:LysM peptidoglycan-binding domain-containing protein [Lacinutrix salivirga]
MKALIYILCFVSLITYAQETNEVKEEFIPIIIEDKEAFISTKTGEYTYREHAITDPTQLQTTSSGVIYKDIKTHTVKKKETLSSIAKKHKISIDELIKDNALKSNDLSIGQELKIIKRLLITSSSPVIGYSGEKRILAKLRPGQTPGELNPPPPPSEIQVSKPTKSTKPAAGITPAVKVTETDDLFQDLTTMESAENDKNEEQEDVEAEVKAKVEPKIVTKEPSLKETKEDSKQEIEEVVEVVEVAETAIENTESTHKIKKPEVLSPSEDEADDTKIYTVVKGDTLYGIAKKHKMTIIALKKLNNLTSSSLSIGQKLKVK